MWQHILKLRLPTAFYHTELTEIRDQTIDTEWNNGEQQQDKVLCSLIGSFACVFCEISDCTSVNSVELTSSILENMSGVANKEFSLSIILQ